MKIIIEQIHHENGHCDDCGSFSSITVNFKNESGEILETYNYNDHLGGNIDIYNPEDVLQKVLALINHEVEFTNVYENNS